MKAVIMAGGEGSRLRPLTCDLPKPLVKLCGKPISKYILDLLNDNDCTDAVFTLHYLGKQIEDYFEGEKYKNINLSFSYETQMLGTAGCVKNALKNFKFDDDILIISGDAMCDFDLKAALSFHKKSNADATIIAKHVDDPREYGLIIEKNGTVTGFCEKPSFSGCVTDLANTGIYVISKRVLDIIPDNTKWDFAQNVFPQMLESGMKLVTHIENGYWCDIGDLTTYKSCQNDMLDKKVNCSFVSSSLEGAKTPYYAGKNITVGENTNISAHCIINDNVTIGKNCKLNNSIVLSGAFIGDNVTLNYAIVCENAVVESNCSVFENAVIGAESIVGRGCIVKSNVKIWNNKKIPPEKSVNADVKYNWSAVNKFSENGCYGQTNADITPSFMTILGSSCASVFGDNILVGAAKNTASAILSAAFCTGYSASGCNIVNCGNSSIPMLIYLSRIMNSHAIVHINAAESADISLFSRGGMPLTRVQERRLESAVNRGDYKNAAWNSFGTVSAFKNARLIYSNMLSQRFNFNSRYNISVKCNNVQILSAVKPIVEKISNKSGEKLTIAITSDGRKAELVTENGTTADYVTLTLIAASEFMKSGSEAAIPIEFPSSFEYIAKSLGKNIHRYYSCSNDNSDLIARKIAANEDFLFDGAILAFDVLNIVSESLMTIEEYLKALPKIATANRFLKIAVPPQRILNRIAKSDRHGIGEGVVLGDDGNRVLLRSNRRGDGLFLFAEGMSAETAATLCDDVEKQVKKLIDDQML